MLADLSLDRYAAGADLEKVVTPRGRRELAYKIIERLAARLVPLCRDTLRYVSRKDTEEALRSHLRELAAVRVRFGYRRFAVLLTREEWAVSAKHIYRITGK